ncbi:TRAP transporter small permease, partial [Mammaliicoccus fleurettii]
VSGIFIIFYAIYNLLDKGELEAVKEANQEDGGERV